MSWCQRVGGEYKRLSLGFITRATWTCIKLWIESQIERNFKVSGRHGDHVRNLIISPSTSCLRRLINRPMQQQKITASTVCKYFTSHLFVFVFFCSSLWHLSRASTWMSEWPVSITFDPSETRVLPPERCVVPRCSPIRVWIDYLLLKTRHDRAGHQRESKTKSQISQTLYQSNILEAQSRYLQESHRLQREMCEGFFLTSELGIVADQRLCLLSSVAAWHNRRILLRPPVCLPYETNAT